MSKLTGKASGLGLHSGSVHNRNVRFDDCRTEMTTPDNHNDRIYTETTSRQLRDFYRDNHRFQTVESTEGAIWAGTRCAQWLQNWSVQKMDHFFPVFPRGVRVPHRPLPMRHMAPDGL